VPQQRWVPERVDVRERDPEKPRGEAKRGDGPDCDLQRLERGFRVRVEIPRGSREHRDRGVHFVLRAQNLRDRARLRDAARPGERLEAGDDDFALDAGVGERRPRRHVEAALRDGGGEDRGQTRGRVRELRRVSRVRFGGLAQVRRELLKVGVVERRWNGEQDQVVPRAARRARDKVPFGCVISFWGEEERLLERTDDRGGPSPDGLHGRASRGPAPDLHPRV
jgi:hypothetical protein